MRRDPTFLQMVRVYQQQGAIVDVDPVAAPITERAPDGTVTNRFLADFGGVDPREHFCICGEVKAPAAKVCEMCAREANL